MEILYEDQNMICAVKDPGVPSQPDPSERPTCSPFSQAKQRKSIRFTA